MHPRRRTLAGLAAGVFVSTPLAVDAQRPPSARDSAAADSARRIAPVVVTVLRAPLDAALAPFAVSVNTAQDVQRARPGLGLDEALRAVPGVQADNRFNAALGERVSVRGFGARTQFGVRGVKVIVDGIPATLPDGQTTLNHVELGVLGRAEVIRGPASALYGNAAGGVLQLETERAPDAAFREQLRVLAGADGLRRAQSVSAGTEGGADYLLSLSRLDYGGFRAFSDARTTRGSARVGYAFARDTVSLVANAVDYDARNPGSLSDSLLRVDRSSAFANNVRQRTGETGRQAQLGATWRRGIGGGALGASVFGVTRSIDNPIPNAIIDLSRRAGGARLAFDGRGSVARVPLRWTMGGEAQRQSDDRRNFANALGARGALTLDQDELVTTGALFAQATAALTSRVTALAGLRHDRVRFSASDRLVSATNPDDSGERPMQATSPSLGLSVTAGRALTVYGNVATSFETPTTTELANQASGAGGFNPELDPQRAVSYEVGAKGGTTAGASVAVTYELALYRAELSDALVPFEVPGAAGRQFYRNAGSAVHQGVEASLRAQLLAAGALLAARSAYTLTDARFDRYAVGTATFDGNRVPGVARHRLDASVSVSPASGVARGAFAEVDLRAQSATVVDDANRARSPGYALTSVRVGLGERRLLGAEVAPFAGVSNVFDVRYNASVTVNAFGGRYFEPGPGRAAYVGLDLGFGTARR
jgi:iron complex outermembrane receptor protein